MKLKLITFFVLLTLIISGQEPVLDSIYKLLDQKKLYEAISFSSGELKKLQSSDSLYQKLLRVRVECNMALTNFEEGIKDLKTLIALDPKDAVLYNSIAYAYWASGDNESMITSIEKGIKLAPKDPHVLSNASYFYGQVDKFNESIKYSTEGLAQNTADSTITGTLLNNRGYSYMGLKEYYKAYKDINESIKFFPTNPFAYYYRALANIGLKKMETVCTDLEKAKSLGGIDLTKEALVKYCK